MTRCGLFGAAREGFQRGSGRDLRVGIGSSSALRMSGVGGEDEGGWVERRNIG